MEIKINFEDLSLGDVWDLSYFLNPKINSMSSRVGTYGRLCRVLKKNGFLEEDCFFYPTLTGEE
jgi:hypothetical protein